jgi:hypothetical protein
LVYGFARAHWTEERTRTEGTGENRRTHTYTVYYEGQEIFLNSKTYLFGHHGAEAKEIQPGIHRYNFSCQLPDMLPYTMDARHGNISYSVEAKLDIPWKFDKETKVPFTVLRHDDLNIYPELRIAQKMEQVKNFCCLFCRSGPLMLTVSVPCCGFAGGNRVPIRIEYINRSNVEVESTKVKLKRIISFTSHSPESKTRCDTEKMVELYVDGVSKNGSVELETNLEIPIVMMNTNQRFCHVVRVSYYLEVEGVVSGCHTNVSIQIPIEIGSVPIQLDTGFNVPQNTYYPPQPSAPLVQLPSAPKDDYKTDLRKLQSINLNLPVNHSIIF